jgi:hypothetical protein
MVPDPIYFKFPESQIGEVIVDNSLTRLQKFDCDFLHSRKRFDGQKSFGFLSMTMDGTYLLSSNSPTGMALLLPLRKAMDTICRHCDELIVGEAYRVTSEDEGIIMLDMIVCHLCFLEAKKLGLHAEAIAIPSNPSSARTHSNHGQRLGV